MKRLNRRLPSVPTNQFSMVPRGDVPRSKFVSTATYKTTLDADILVPIFTEEVLPGDHYSGSGTLFLRMSTPIFPLMDNVHLDTHFFFVPNRLVWDNWQKFMGEQASPNASIDYLIPQADLGPTDRVPASMANYFGIPNNTQVPGPLSVNALPFRMYNLIFNEWFRDENLVDPSVVAKGDGPDTTGFSLRVRGKRHDYFTSCLPWPLKGGQSVNLPVGGIAQVKTAENRLLTGPHFALLWSDDGGGTSVPSQLGIASPGGIAIRGGTAPGTTAAVYPSNLYADLSTASGATINSIRLAVATQQLLERDARGGTRYAELLRSHFGVDPQDARLQRPEYIGGGSLTMQTQAIPQTSGTANDPSTGYSPTPIGSLGGASTGSGQHRFSYAATEHGWIIGLASIRADLTYQQGLHRSWTRRTKYDFYWPAYAFLGEQAVRLDEIYCQGTAEDQEVFGYQERFAEYRYRVSLITGQFQSGIAGTLDNWHLSQFFGTKPLLNNTFISSNTPMSRVLAAGSLAQNQQFLLDSVWTVAATRPLPTRSVPGLLRF